MTDLNDAIAARIDELFAEPERSIARAKVLERCGGNLPLLRGKGKEIERVQWAVLHLSQGSLERLDRIIRMAQRDWRDVLVAAGMGNDPELRPR